MATQDVYDVSDRLRYMFKKHPFFFLDYPIEAFLHVPKNVLHVEDICSYIHCKIESIGDSKIHKELEKMCKNDLSLKLEHTRLEELNLVKYMFYTTFDNHEWT